MKRAVICPSDIPDILQTRQRARQNPTLQTVICRDFRSIPKPAHNNISGCSSFCQICHDLYKGPYQTPVDENVTETALVKSYKDQCTHIRKVQTNNSKQNVLEQVVKFKLDKKAKSEILYRADCELEGYCLDRLLGTGSCSTVYSATVNPKKYLKSKRLQAFIAAKRTRQVEDSVTCDYPFLAVEY